MQNYLIKRWRYHFESGKLLIAISSRARERVIFDGHHMGPPLSLCSAPFMGLFLPCRGGALSPPSVPSPSPVGRGVRGGLRRLWF